MMTEKFDFGHANQGQRKAITTTEGPVLITAGPGTGKTFTLVQRIIYLIDQRDIAPDEIFVATFTEKAAKELGYWCENPTGEIIENRGSQITYSALGQWATPEDKHSWDPDLAKRKEIVSVIEPKLADIGIKIGIGGATSIDITLPGKLQPGGNDYPVKEMGIDTIEVTSHEDTNWVLRGILAVS